MRHSNQMGSEVHVNRASPISVSIWWQPIVILISILIIVTQLIEQLDFKDSMEALNPVLTI